MSRPRTGRRRSRLVRWLGIAALVALAPVVALGTTIAATGTITVSVQEHHRGGTRIWIPVPALVADLGIAAIDLLAPADALEDARREAGPWLPALRDLAGSLEDCPDATFVEVASERETVRVRKDGRNLEVDVRSDDADVSVRVPARLVGRALSILS